MYRTEFIPLLEFRLRIFKYFKCVNFEFNPKSGRFITCSSPRYISSYRRQSLLSLVYCTLLGLNLCFGPITIFQKLQGFAFFILFLNGLILRWDYNLEYGRSQCQMIHTLVAFEAAIVSGKEFIQIILSHGIHDMMSSDIANKFLHNAHFTKKLRLLFIRLERLLYI